MKRIHPEVIGSKSNELKEVILKLVPVYGNEGNNPDSEAHEAVQKVRTLGILAKPLSRRV
ncbi:MAG: hypothetical protein JXJ22_13605 [Bacteroidales bacterium]|nr:hypothetical protein [Bacteroidales bacterium]